MFILGDSWIGAVRRSVSSVCCICLLIWRLLELRILDMQYASSSHSLKRWRRGRGTDARADLSELVTQYMFSVIKVRMQTDYAVVCVNS